MPLHTQVERLQGRGSHDGSVLVAGRGVSSAGSGELDACTDELGSGEFVAGEYEADELDSGELGTDESVAAELAAAFLKR